MIRVFRVLDGVETIAGEVDSLLRVAALIEQCAQEDRVKGEAAFYTATNIGGDEE